MPAPESSSVSSGLVPKQIMVSLLNNKGAKPLDKILALTMRNWQNEFSNYPIDFS
ncbi:hypothetical protein [Paenibacillus monticola]|uniref:hypothetical protein n=1 Tax=Paenibacillus monticola TaxID=2666075 RepID=UPI001E61567E|nr:hypothetical protein [Paenibacillus monticola]